MVVKRIRSVQKKKWNRVKKKLADAVLNLTAAEQDIAIAEEQMKEVEKNMAYMEEVIKNMFRDKALMRSQIKTCLENQIKQLQDALHVVDSKKN